MSRIILSRSAIDKLLADPMLRRWRHSELGRKTPVFWYFRRAYTKRNDGTIVEHGDGFSLTFAEPEEAVETHDIACRSVAVADGLDILVVAERERLLGSFMIGWRGWTYTYEPLTT